MRAVLTLFSAHCITLERNDSAYMDGCRMPDGARKASATWQNNAVTLEMLLVAAIALTFLDVVKQGFVGDDWFWLYNAKFTMSHLSGWESAFGHANGSGQYRPLTQNVFFWLAFLAFGLYAPAYHIVALVVFSLSALILFRIVTHLVKDRALALGAAIFFAVSPLHYGGLSWVSAFSETGAIFCFILTLYFVIVKRSWVGYLAYIACLLSNETASVVPAVAFLYYKIYERETIVESTRKTLGYWGIFALYITLRVTVLGLHAAGAFALGDTFGATFLHVMGAVVHVIGVAPTSYNVTHANGAEGVAARIVEYFYLGTFAFLMVAIIWRSIRDRVVRRFVLFGMSVFIVGMLPELTFSQHDWALYNLGIPDVGIAFIVVSLGMDAEMRNWKRRYVIFVASLFFLFSVVQVWGPGGLNEVQGLNVLGQQMSLLSKHISAEIKRSSAHRGPVTLRISGDRNKYTSWMVASPFWLDVLTGARSGSRVCYSRTCRADITVHWNSREKRFQWARENPAA
ncbi:hypothetical protein A9R16_006345 [Acidiferrobacter thiooxydans]|uniref:hypothetical protein n=1 Tax=Acidiferrobacter thiooxydans TaxID=163359 RepID=UPI001147A336|nr:hypothetical protein [Acidiferrobacter thiooxydans]UEO01010.1 hypothetical protein A9R16_006345 [Acidiferrobacter thiooxydans]